LNLAALFSGGKDSTYSIYKARQMGHEVSCLVTIMPHSPESHLLHHPNIRHTSLQAESMGIPQIVSTADSENTGDELEVLRALLTEAKAKYGIRGIVHGGILSEFQKGRFESLANDLGLQVVAPLWKMDQRQYMHDLLNSGFEFVISSVSCDGLDESWLGKKITNDDLEKLESLSEKYKFNLSFEGGEAETFVTNCPLFKKLIEISESTRLWDGCRGTIEILQAGIMDQC